MGNLQHKIAEDNKGLALVMMVSSQLPNEVKKQISNSFRTSQLYVSPIALAAVILSMDRDVISFIPANFGSFVGLVLIFVVLGLFIHVVLQYESWSPQAVMALAGQQRWARKLCGSSIKKPLWSKERDVEKQIDV